MFLLILPPRLVCQENELILNTNNTLRGPSINYVVSVGEGGVRGGNLRDYLLRRPYLIKKRYKGGGAQKVPILRQNSLWMTCTHSIVFK